MKAIKKRFLLFILQISNKLILLACALIFSSFTLNAQVELKGTVKDKDGLAVIGATVLLKGTTNGTITDLDGNFKISVTGVNAIEVRSIGYISQEIAITNETKTLDIVLEADVIGLEEVVVVGYGVQRKSDLTSAVTSVKASDFVQGAVKDVGQLLQGKVAGLTVTNANGDPTAPVTISLRGITSLNSVQSPFVIVDGVPGDMNSVSPQDIASIDVLKEGSATAIYGSRGTNGVIIITTKKGTKNSPLEVSYSAYASTQTIYKRPDMSSAAEYRNDIATGRSHKLDEDTINFTSTNWLDQILQKNPLSQVHNLTITGGKENTVYTASLAYEKKEGIFITSGIERYIGRFDVTQSFFDNLMSINAGVVVNNTSTNQVYPGAAYLQALVWNPTLPVMDDSTGGYMNIDDFEMTNPVSMMKEEHNEVISRSNRMYGNLKILPFEGLTLSVLFSKDLWNENSGNYQTNKHPSTFVNKYYGLATREAKTNRNDLLELTADYTKSLGSHNFTVLGGYSYEYNLYDWYKMQNSKFAMDGFEFYDLSQGAGPRDTTAQYAMYEKGERNSWKMAGFVGRVNYNYASKYYFQASLRRDASSKFGKNNKWGNFPAFQVGWKISEEPFMKFGGIIDLLKIRAGYGVTGIVPEKSYMSKMLMEYREYFYYNGAYTRVLQPYQNPNPDLKWETKYETNIGLDFSFLKNRVSGNIDYYDRTTKDMLWEYPVPTPPYKTNRLLLNVGEMNSTGIEVLVNIVPVETKDFSWTSTILYSRNKNKLVNLSTDKYKAASYQSIGGLGAPLWGNTQRIYAGQELGQFYAYHLVGIQIADTGSTWLVENSLGDTINALDARDSSDMRMIGSGIPKYYLGWNNTFRYKGFDLSITTRGAFGHKVLNMTKMYYSNLVKTPNYLKSAFDPILGTTPPDNLGPQYTDYYIEDGSYYKIDNITLGYNLKLEKNSYLKSARIYISGSNLYTFTKYTGQDPETETQLNYKYGIAPGLDPREKYPTTRTYTVGINVVF